MTKRRPANKQRLSELAVKRLNAKASPQLVWDTKQSGLVLRIRPSGTRTWYCIYSRHGRPRWYRLGDAGAIGLAAARELAAEAMLAVAKGGDPAAERRAERSKGTFEELAGAYVERHAKRHNRSWKQANALVRRFLLPRWGKLQAASISRADVKAIMGGIDAPVLANQVIAAASAIFSWAIKEEIIANNPCKLVDRNPTTSRERVLSDSEIPKFWNAFDDAGLVASSALKFILLSGQRPGEVAHMRHEHIKDGWWELPGAPLPALGWPGTKNGATHRVWLPHAAQALIAELRDEDQTTGFVFAGERGGHVGKLDAAMRLVCKKLKVERATPHDGRRTHGTMITRLGFGRDAMNRIQNHREGGIADVYDRHHYEVEIKKIMEAVAAKIMALVEGSEAENVVALAAGGRGTGFARLKARSNFSNIVDQTLAEQQAALAPTPTRDKK
jgi:integrase